MTTLREVLSLLKNARPLDPLTFACYERAVNYFEAFKKASINVEDLTPTSLNEWIVFEESRYSGVYARNLRRDFLVVWNFAADLELCQYPNEARSLTNCEAKKHLKHGRSIGFQLIEASTQLTEPSTTTVTIEPITRRRTPAQVSTTMVGLKISEMLTWDKIYDDGIGSISSEQDEANDFGKAENRDYRSFVSTATLRQQPNLSAKCSKC